MSVRARISLVSVFLVCFVTSLTLAGSAEIVRGVEAQQVFVRGQLSGVWLITLTLPDEDAELCPGNQLLPETATLIGNFTQSGEFLSSSDLPAIQVPVVDPSTGMPVLDESDNPIIYSVEIGFGHGLWSKTPKGGFVLESWRLAKLNGQAIGIAKGQSNVDLDRTGQQMSGDIRLQLSLGDGTVLPPACGTMGGVRLND